MLDPANQKGVVVACNENTGGAEYHEAQITHLHA